MSNFSFWSYLFSTCPIVDGWHLINEEKLDQLFPNETFHHCYAKTPNYGRKIEFPVKIRPKLQRCNHFRRQVVELYLKKKHVSFN